MGISASARAQRLVHADDLEPLWKSMLHFDKDGDSRIARNEITKDFTFPHRPELPAGHPGFGIPLPGVVSVVKTGDTFELLDQYDPGEPAFVTPAFDGTTIYIRTASHLHAFRAAEAEGK